MKRKETDKGCWGWGAICTCSAASPEDCLWSLSSSTSFWSFSPPFIFYISLPSACSPLLCFHPSPPRPPFPFSQLSSASAAYYPAATVHFWLCRLLARSLPEYPSLLKSELNIVRGALEREAISDMPLRKCLCDSSHCQRLRAQFRQDPYLTPPLKVAVTTAQWMQCSQLGRVRIPAQARWGKLSE